jgi:hypothetical protein
MNLFNHYNVKIIHLSTNNNKVEEEVVQNSNENNAFYEWLQNNIQYKTDHVLKLADVVTLYSGKHMGTKESSKYKTQISEFVKKMYPNISHQYQNTTYNGVVYRGWLHLSLI